MTKQGSNRGTVLVTGASGYVGGAALRRLSAAGHTVAAMVRDTRKAERSLPAGTDVRVADYDDRPGLERALAGVTHLLFVASDGDARDVMRHHDNVLAAAAASDVEHIVFTSIVDVDEASPFYFTPVYREAERRLAALGIPCTTLRCGLYADFLWSRWVEPATRTGSLSLPVGGGRVAPVSRDDVAAAAAAAFTAERHRGRTYELTGPRSFSFDEIAELASGLLARRGSDTQTPLRYEPCSPSDYLRRAWAEMPDPWPHAFSTLCASIAQGRFANVSRDIECLLDRPAEPLEDFFRTAAGPDRERGA